MVSTAVDVTQVLLTVAVLSFGVVAAAADLNRTHACNPLWTAHARFHVVWQTLTHMGVSLVALYLIWLDSADPRERFLLVAALCGCVLVGFASAALLMRAYGGSLTDPNGYPPIQRRIAGRLISLDFNVLLFSTAAVVLLSALIAILQ